MIVVVRPKPGMRLRTAELRDIAQGLGQPVFIDDIVPATRLLSDTVATPRHRTLLFGLLGALGFILTLVGIFGVTAYAVSRRTQEIGVRMAFGASPQQVVGTVIADAVWPVMIGIAIGLGGAMFSTRVVATFLFQTTPTEPTTFAAVAIVLAMAAGLATATSASCRSRRSSAARGLSRGSRYDSSRCPHGWSGWRDPVTPAQNAGSQRSKARGASTTLESLRPISW
jgi:hypothetical protein